MTTTTTTQTVFTHARRYTLADALLDAGDMETLTLLQQTRPGTVLDADHALVAALAKFEI